MQRKRWLLVSHLFFIFPQKNKGERFVRISLPYLFEVVYFPTAPYFIYPIPSTDAVSVILSELLSYEHPPNDGAAFLLS